MGKDSATGKRIYGVTGRINVQNGVMGTERGFWRSDNDGFNFSLVHSFGNAESNSLAHVVYVGNDTLILCYYNNGYKFYKSTDRGVNWIYLSGAPETTRPFYSSHDKKVLSLDYLGGTIVPDPQDSQSVLYISVLYQTLSNTQEIIEYFVSVDGGMTWQSSPGPEKTSKKKSPSDAYPSDMNAASFLMQVGDDGAIPGLYD